ncbi:MAG: aminotransferase class V-fold PLP-dependent enzyme [Candidatus Latescibacterota bacterium]|nr:aminotransferase class V-fold PLP-dependent enzyme [Candidatus Latescibacterota bacterium]
MTYRLSSIYQEIGVEPIINCRGTFTIIGGSIELPEVLIAMERASQNFVQYDELAEGVGRRLAELTGAEWGMISSGCAAGMKHVTAACITGGDPEKLIRIPDLQGFEKTQVIVPAYSRNAYDHALRNVGIEFVTVESPEEMSAAISSRTAMVYLVTGGASEPGSPLSLEVIAEIARPRGIPILADAAAENLTVPNVHLQQGADIITYSGGKALCGPQCTGLVIGRKDLILAAWQASAPHHGPGRDDKVGKEEIMGLLAAVELWLERDHEAEWQVWLARLDIISSKVKSIGEIETEIINPSGLSNRSPSLEIRWNETICGIRGEELAELVGRSTPRIALAAADGVNHSGICITPSQMQEGEAETVASRLSEILSVASPRSSEQRSPSLDLSGHWQVQVEYYASTVEHQWILEQDGNWLGGEHRSTFSAQPIKGVIEGTKITLESSFSQPGNMIPFLFSGESINGMITGEIHLGEYQKASFVALKISHDKGSRPVFIPQGPPLAT